MKIIIKNLKLFELKINQNFILYNKNSLLKILIKHYLILFKRVFFKKKKLSSNELIISNIDSIKGYKYLSEYKDYIKYKDISVSYLEFFMQIIQLPVFIYLYLILKTKYKNQIFESYLMSLCIIDFCKVNKIKEVAFFGYDYYLHFLSASLKLQQINIKVIQYCNSGFLGNHNLVKVDTLYCRTKIHKNYMKNRKNIFITNEIKYLFEPKYTTKTTKNTVGVYTTGYYARVDLKFSSPILLQKGIEAEKAMIESILNYALNNPNIEFVLFIHLHNNIENIYDARKYYQKFLALDNVRLQYENENSIKNFSKFDLGICCMSEIFFDRYERGYKTVLFNPIILDDFIYNSSLVNVTLRSKENNLDEKINKFLHMSTKEYFGLLE